MNLVNATPFGAMALPSADRDGSDLLLVVVAARFAIPAPSSATALVLPTPMQPPPPLADVYRDDPASSSLEVEGQSAYCRPATDIYLTGEACSPGERPVTEMDVRIRVGPCSLGLHVAGERIWLSSPNHGAVPSDPEPFTRMPLVWERAYGGVAPDSSEQQPSFEPRNPVGCGVGASAEALLGARLPNIEHQSRRLRRVGDRAVPVGTGPLARSWQPRKRYAGTYDEVWRRDRAPLWPHDFDERFFNAAPQDLQAQPHLTGGEPVRLEGLHPEGVIAFELPALNFAIHSRFADREVRQSPILDGLHIDTGALELTLYYRAAVPAPLALIRHRETLLRLREPWEAAGS